jgi:DGQHR domain-containing protein
MNLAIEHDTGVDTKFPVTLSLTARKNLTLAVGVMKAGTLTKNYVIPRRDQRNKTGYQREASSSRVNKLVTQLSLNRVDLPTAVLLNMRDYDPEQHVVDEDGQTYLNLNGSPLYVVDGQHRIVALDKLVDSDPDRWSDFEIPFSCLLGADEREEMEQFYVVNSTAKSVRTDLAFDLLKQRAETDPEVMKGLVESNEQWKVEAQALTEALAETEIWRSRIRFPGEEKGVTTINSSGMATSLKALLDTPYFGAVSRPNQIKILDSYWKGITLCLPEVISAPQEHALQKSTGVQVMHSILVQIIEYLRSKGYSPIEPDSYADVMRDPLEELEGDTSAGGIVTGADFWRAGPDGAAGQYSSNAGRRVLTAKIKGLLPDLEIE